jgi:PhzF family phenazine biosynthesis protein
MQFYIIDAFTDQLFGGNPAGVVILPRGEAFPREEVMQKTAAELRYSETAFILPLSEDTFHIRYFTPAAEVELCGHATIASFVALQDAGLVSWNGFYRIETLVGSLGVSIEDGFILMEMATPVAMGVIDQKRQLEEIYSIMGIPASQGIATLDRDWILYPELISTGLPDLLLPVADPMVLEDIKPDFPALAKLSKKYGVIGVHAFALGEGLIGGENLGDGRPLEEQITAYCRNFAPLVGIDEEAATGTSNGALTYYLYKNALIEDGANCVFLQGEAMERPSKIMGRITEIEEQNQDDPQGFSVKIQVGGNGVILAKGEMEI